MGECVRGLVGESIESISIDRIPVLPPRFGSPDSAHLGPFRSVELHYALHCSPSLACKTRLMQAPDAQPRDPENAASQRLASAKFVGCESS